MEVRAFTEGDRPGLRELFGRAGQGAPGAGLWGHHASEAAVYLDPYLGPEPAVLLLAVDEGRPVGYLAGCLDSAAFPGEDERIGRAVREHRLYLRAGPARFFARALTDLAWAAARRQPTAKEFTDPRWPAHLHLNVAPEARGTGAADLLMDRWLERAADRGVPGCHLRTLSENTRAVRFFRRKGFVPHGLTPVVPGLRHAGRRPHQLTHGVEPRRVTGRPPRPEARLPPLLGRIVR
ncbi:GNAT family N-acetyltransferase [Streptomyces sp. PmtG]